ncbi:unnamed protein product [Leptosia nina]|uniref:Chitin-binding type-2 domain-containing protein n=1 Tax=Leptosia nina TaxID=320188 RepID=A0AAV1JR19_9NEOP
MYLVLFLFSCFTGMSFGAIDCTEKGAGRFPDPKDATCKLYGLCVYVASNNSYQFYNYTCPETTYFDPASEVCSASYDCPTGNDTVTCQTAGRIPDSTDTTCQNYFMCIEAPDGTIVPYPQSCPSYSIFNPEIGVCTSDYQCPT